MVRVPSPPQSRSKAIVCVSTPRVYPRSGYFLVSLYREGLVKKVVARLQCRPAQGKFLCLYTSKKTISTKFHRGMYLIFSSLISFISKADHKFFKPLEAGGFRLILVQLILELNDIQQFYFIACPFKRQTKEDHTLSK